MLFRARNPLAERLRESQCVFRLAVPAGPQRSRILSDECARIGASLHWEVGECGEALLTLAASHAVIDAFGGLFLLSHFGREVCERMQPSAATKVSSARPVGAFKCFHFLGTASAMGADASNGTGHAPTLTQRFLRRLLSLPLCAASRIALAVAKDDTRTLTADSYLGNSLVLLPFESAELLGLASAGRERWRVAVGDRSDRVMALALRRPSLLTTPDVLLTVSSVGDLGRLPWAAPFDPSCFEMVPTPAAGAGTVVVWGSGQRQALTLCAREEHPLVRCRDDVRRAWQEALDATAL